ncbi:hypothetical protein PR202_gb14105 [Eleusine coracana subsp. coracana]|uniref:At1g61320/AtMIF1 LRR domain-containing protein n=1 Tax=Eleusine coracana subsp. coracana TaxID=191504 RepID=A0AAV5ETS1_ELECO|nr:hypothetical protein PR202_gb14105 [Eleusine coracana subsp. coracana]
MNKGVHLHYLHLTFVSLRPPADFTCFSDLTKLILEEVRVTDEDLQCFLSNCNNLVHLRIAYCNTLESFRTHHLNQLKHLHVESCPSLKVIESNRDITELCYRGSILPLVLSGSSELTSICIKSTGDESVLDSVFDKLPDNLSGLEALSLHGPEFERACFPRKFLKFTSLHHLILELALYGHPESPFDVLDIACLLEAAPLMEKFDLHVTLKAMKIVSRIKKLEPGEWHAGLPPYYAGGYRVALEFIDHIDRWVKYAIKSKAEDLILSFPTTRFRPSTVPYDFPFEIVNMKNSMHLRYLHLTFVSLRPPADVTCFSNLTKLILENVRVTDEDLQCFLSKCNSLIYLRIAYCNKLESLRTHHLNELKHLHIESCPLLKVTERACFLRKLPKFISLSHLILELAIYGHSENPFDVLDIGCLLEAAPLMEKFDLHKDQLELALHILHNAVALKAMKIVPRVEKKLEPREWHSCSPCNSADGYSVASEFICREDHNNVVEVSECVEAS